MQIKPVTPSLAEKLKLPSMRGVHVSGVSDNGPAKLAGIMIGDVIVRFDGEEILDSKDIVRFVTSSPVGKGIEIVFIRNGKEETRIVKFDRLEDGEEQQQAALTPTKPVVKKTLGLELSNMSDELRTKFKIKDTVKGVVILGVDVASDNRLNAGETIVEISQEAVANADDFQAKIDKLKKDRRRSALLLVAQADGALRFVAVALQ